MLLRRGEERLQVICGGKLNLNFKIKIKMELFKTLSEVIGNGCTVKITVSQKDGEMTVSVLPGNDLVKDSAKNMISPLSVTGTPEELDNGFVELISAPIKKASGLLSNLEAFEKSAEEAKQRSKMEEESKAAEAKRKKDLTAYIELAKTNLKEDKYADATTCLSSASKLAVSDAEKQQIAVVEKEVKNASGDGALFGGNPDKSDGKNVTPTEKKAKAAEKKDCETELEEEEE